MEEIKNIEDRKKIIPLCNDVSDAVLWSCIEGNIGEIWIEKNQHIESALVIAADFCFLLGCVSDKTDSDLKELLEKCRNKVVITHDDTWVTIIKDNFTESIKEYRRYAIKREPDIFKKDVLVDYINQVKSDYKLVKMDEEIYFKALQNDFTADFCCYFTSYNEFSKHGVGYFVLDKGEIVAGASSYTYCKDSVEITIGTVPEYRRKGLAKACAASLILECLERKIYPRWDAANIESVALAEKLGYHFENDYIVYSF